MDEPEGTTLLQRVGALWAEILRLDEVGPDDDFLDLGGHSLAAIQVTAQVRDFVGPDVPLALIFERASLRDYVEALGEFAG